MKSRELVRGNGGNSRDLLVCFPSRAHLTLMPKPICSPSRPNNEPNKRHHHPRPTNRGQASPLFKTKTKPTGSEISEPTSPKVTCAGQIKVRPKPTSKNWQSVIQEIERLHTHRNNRKKSTWVETLGIKKDVLHFFTTLKSLHFHFGCFRSFQGSTISSAGNSDNEEEDEEEIEKEDRESSPSRKIFSKWFMVLQENQSLDKEDEERERSFDGSVEKNVIPPSNALLLMRCRSAPAKQREESKVEQEEEKKSGKMKMEEEEKEKVVLMRYSPDFFKLSSDIAKETWAFGRRDPYSRSRSWKR